MAHLCNDDSCDNEHHDRPTLCSKLGLKPLTRSNIIGYYLPAQGFVSYTALAVNVLNPRLCSTLLPKRDVTNILLFNAFLGCGMYLYSRKHMHKLTITKCILYSAFGSMMFCLGSVLCWAVMRGCCVRSTAVGVSLAIVTSIGFTTLAVGYVNAIDNAAT